MFEIYLDDLTEQAIDRLAQQIDINEICEDVPIAVMMTE